MGMEMGRSVSVRLARPNQDIDVMREGPHLSKNGGFDVAVNEVGRVDTLYA